MKYGKAFTSIVHILFGWNRMCICMCLTIRMEVHAPEIENIGRSCNYMQVSCLEISPRPSKRIYNIRSRCIYTRDLNHRGKSLSNINIIFSKHIRQHRIMNRYTGVILLFLVTLLGTLSTAVFTAIIPGFYMMILL